MKRLNGWAVGLVGAGGLLIGAGCAKAPETASAAGSPLLQPSTVQAGSTLVDCGPGQRVLLQQANGMTQVQCVPGTTMAGGSSAFNGSDFVQPLPLQATVPATSVYREAAAAPRLVSYEEPRPAPRPVRRVATRGRAWQKSAVIIGGTTAAGAGVGALLDGGSGAKKGAVAGLVGGLVYDIATRDR